MGPARALFSVRQWYVWPLTCGSCAVPSPVFPTRALSLSKFPHSRRRLPRRLCSPSPPAAAHATPSAHAVLLSHAFAALLSRVSTPPQRTPTRPRLRPARPRIDLHDRDRDCGNDTVDGPERPPHLSPPPGQGKLAAPLLSS